MAGPIPVFSFVFAAYAATSGGKARKAESGASTALAPDAPFRTAWRTKSTLGGALFAKIRVLKGSGPIDLQLAVKSSGETGDGIWVGGIVESGLGFVGAPVEDLGNTCQVAAGRQIRFHVINVLDWRVGNCPGVDPEALCESAAPDFEPPLSDTAT